MKIGRRAVKEKVADTIERNTVGKIIKTNEISEQEFISSMFSDDFYNSDFVTEINNKYKESSDFDDNTEKTEENTSKAEIVHVEELKPEVIEFIANEVMNKVRTDQQGTIVEYIQNRATTQEEFYKLELLSYFPIIGIPIYFLMLLTLSINAKGRYDVSIQNFAKAQLRMFWIYVVAHLSVIFVVIASMTSLINIIQRGLAA